MYNLDDKDLDRLSREASEMYEAPGAPSWEDMHQTLDQHLPQKEEKKRRGFFFFLLFAGLVAVGGYLLHNAYSQRKDAAGGPQEESAIAKQTDAGDAKPQPSTKETEIPAQASPSPGQLLHPPSAGDVNLFSDAMIASADPLVGAKQHARSNKSLRVAKDPGAVASRNEVVPQDEPATTALDDSQTDNRAAASSQSTITAGQTADSIVNDTKRNDTTAATPVDSTGTASTETAAAPPSKPPVNKPKKAILLAATAGLDLTTVKYNYANKAGVNIGIMAGYAFNNRISVHTGLVYTQKNYKLKGADYNPPAHYWTTYVDLNTVEGYCRMFEWPVQLRYSFPSRKKTNIFASTGLSTYFMKKEDYTFNYKQNGIPATRSRSYASSAQHYFSVLHISGGIEKKIGRKLSYLIEPYAKLPLSGLGFGHIRMSSFGVNFSLQLRQPLKK